MSDQQKSIIITDQEATMSEYSSAFEHAQYRFKKDHNLDFTIEELQDQTLFDFYLASNGEGAKIVYKGQQQ